MFYKNTSKCFPIILLVALLLGLTACSTEGQIKTNSNNAASARKSNLEASSSEASNNFANQSDATIVNQKTNRTQSEISTKMYNYLSLLKNREDIKDVAMSLNGGDQHNSCVYFASEALRRQGLNIPKGVCSTGSLVNDKSKSISLIYTLQNYGWKVDTNLENLLPGDLCFTTNDSNERPTHVYVFMSWVTEGSYDYANVCDNQSYDYGLTLHKRNVKMPLPGKEATAFFMYYS